MNMYQVVDTADDHKVVATGFTHKEAKRKGDKKSAKVKRDELNATVKNHDPDNPRYIVSRGDDHPHGPSNGVSTKMRGKKSYF